MSIFSDPRRYSDNEEEYLEWKSEAAWECRRDNEYPEEYDYPDDEEGENA